MGLMSFLFGGSESKRVEKFDPDQLGLQQALIGETHDLIGREADSMYAGDTARQNLNSVLRGMNEQRSDQILQSNVTSRLHSSGQAARINKINTAFNQQMNNMRYQHNTQQQNWKQAYDQKAQDWNLGGKYNAIMGMSQLGLASRFDNVQQQTPGLFDVISAVGGAAGSVANAFGSFGGGATQKK